MKVFQMLFDVSQIFVQAASLNLATHKPASNYDFAETRQLKSVGRNSFMRCLLSNTKVNYVFS